MLEKVIKVLKENGFDAYLVGGCVRDELIGKEPKDYDITTNALPEKSMEIFKKNGFHVVETGLKHGTITVIPCEGEAYEVTTFRIDGDYSNNRSPEQVIFTNNLKEDLARRDFTMNAIAKDIETNTYFDPFNGKSDIENKIVRCVGDANQRFNEDALRMLRALRFSVKYGFEIEQKTKDAIIKNAHLLTNISWERRRDEFTKIIVEYDGLLKLRELHMLEYIIPEFKETYNFQQKNIWHIYDVFMHINEAVNTMMLNDSISKLAAVFHDIAKPQTFTVDKNGVGHFFGHPQKSAEMALKIMQRMHYDNDTIKNVCEIVLYHDHDVVPTEKSVKRLLLKMSSVEQVYRLFYMKLADHKAQNIKYGPVNEQITKVHNCMAILDSIINKGEVPSLKSLKIDGYDLLEIGFSGKQLGKELKKLLQYVIDCPSENEKEKLYKVAKKDWEMIK